MLEPVSPGTVWLSEEVNMEPWMHNMDKPDRDRREVLPDGGRCRERGVEVSSSPVAVAAVSSSDPAWPGVTVVGIVRPLPRLVVEGTPAPGGSVQLHLTRLARCQSWNSCTCHDTHTLVLAGRLCGLFPIDDVSSVIRVSIWSPLGSRAQHFQVAIRAMQKLE